MKQSVSRKGCVERFVSRSASAGGAPFALNQEQMAISKSLSRLRDRVSIRLSELGYEVQVYGQTVMRSPVYREALRFAAALRRVFCKPSSRSR